MLNTAIVFFIAFAIGYFFGQQSIKEKFKQRPPVNAAVAPPQMPVDKNKLKIIRK